VILAAWLRVAVTDWVAVATLATPPAVLAVLITWMRSRLRRNT
jgi:hypothetical protein